MPFHLKLFGLPELRDEAGRVVKFRTHKQLALLVYLALEARSRPVSRDSLIDLLWPEFPPSKARHSLSQALSAIRIAVGPNSIDAVRDTVQLNAQIDTDLDHRTLRDVKELGRPLFELERAAGAALAQWVDSARERCRRTAADALARELDGARAAGDLPAVYEHALVLYDVEPMSHVALSALAEQRLLKGDRFNAIRLLKQFITRVESDIGGVAHPDIRRLLRRVETGDPSVGTLPTNSHPDLRRQEHFYGRETELAQLERSWQRAQTGQLQISVIGGAPGIGKTSLVRRFATSVSSRGAPHLLVSCQEIGAAVPFAAVVDLIRDICSEPAVGGTDPGWLSEVSRVYPGLRRQFPGVPEPPTACGESIRLRIAEGLFWMLEAIRDEGPVLVLLEDIQYLDPASAETFQLLIRRMEHSRAMVLASQRSPALGAPGHAADIDLTTSSLHIHLGPLARTHIEDIVRSRLADNGPAIRSVLHEIVELSDGNPYFAEMLAEDWNDHAQGSLVGARVNNKEAWEPPETLRLAFSRQLAGLRNDSRELSNMLAVCSCAMPIAELRTLMGWESSTIDHAALDLLSRGIVRFDEGTLSFKNDLYRAFAYYAIPAAIRRYLHGTIGHSLMQRASADYRVGLHSVFHLVRAGMHNDAHRVVRWAASVAITRGASKEAESALRSVLGQSSSDDNQVYLLLARSLDAQGRVDEALLALREWKPSTTTTAEVAAALTMEASILLRINRQVNERWAAGKRAVAAARLSKDRRLLTGALQVFAEAAAECNDAASLRRIASKASHIASDEQNEETRALALLTQGFCGLTASDWKEGLTAFEQSSAILRRLQLETELRRALNGVGICATSTGQLKKAADAFTEAIRIAERTGDPHLLCVLCTNLAVSLEQAGQFQRARDLYSRALTVGARSTTARCRVGALHNLAGLAIELGALASAEALLDRAAHEAESAGSWVHAAATQLTAADLYLARGEDELAWKIVEDVNKQVSTMPSIPGAIGSLARLVHHMHASTKDVCALREMTQADMPRIDKLGLTERLEVLAITEWAEYKQTGEPCNWSAITKLTAAELYGTIARLIAVGIRPPSLVGADIVSGAQAVQQMFPTAHIYVPATVTCDI